MAGARLAGLLSTLLVTACSEGPAPEAVRAGPPDAGRGRAAYLAYCVTCHARDPDQAGPLGPPVTGASRELLEARILRGGYPPGYVPRRDSAVMPPMPNVAPHIPDLAAYLSSRR